MRQSLRAAAALVMALAVALVTAFPAGAAPVKEKLMDPSKLTEQSPGTYRVKLETTKGNIVMEVRREWAPIGADRFYNLVKNGFYDGVKFFRVVPNFVVQFGIAADPGLSSIWKNANISDDPVKQSNKKNYVTYAKTQAPNSRSTQLFINLKDNAFLDSQGFAPFAEVVEGVDVIDKLHSGYGDTPTALQGRMFQEGNAFLEKQFPQLDSVKKAVILSSPAKTEKAAGEPKK